MQNFNKWCTRKVDRLIKLKIQRCDAQIKKLMAIDGNWWQTKVTNPPKKVSARDGHLMSQVVVYEWGISYWKQYYPLHHLVHELRRVCQEVAVRLALLTENNPNIILLRTCSCTGINPGSIELLNWLPPSCWPSPFSPLEEPESTITSSESSGLWHLYGCSEGPAIGLWEHRLVRLPWEEVTELWWSRGQVEGTVAAEWVEVVAMPCWARNTGIGVMRFRYWLCLW